MRRTIGFLTTVLFCLFVYQPCSSVKFSKEHHEDDLQADFHGVYPHDTKSAEVLGEKHSQGSPWKADEKMVAYLQRQKRKSIDKILPELTCDVCYLLVKVIRELAKSGKAKKVVIDAATDICIFFKIQDKRVCKMITHEYEVQYKARIKYRSEQH